MIVATHPMVVRKESLVATMGDLVIVTPLSTLPSVFALMAIQDRIVRYLQGVRTNPPLHAVTLIAVGYKHLAFANLDGQILMYATAIHQA